MVNIQIQRLSKSYQQSPVMTGLDLTIPDQQITTLIGPSGSGKSTLLNMIAGLQTPTSGCIKFDDQVIFDSATNQNVPPAARHLAMVFQDFALWPHMTVFQNVAFAIAPKLDQAALTERVHAALQQVGLVDLAQRYPSALSGGQQQRVALARAIAVRPQLILFDEALSALDPQLRAQLQLEISDLIHQNHLTAIFVTHDRQEALRISDHVVLIKGGQVVQTGTASELYERPQTAFAASFIGPVNVIDEHRGIRPEHVTVAPLTREAEYVGKVVTSTFLGDHFDVLLEVGQHRWHVNTAAPCTAPTVALTLDTQSLLNY